MESETKANIGMGVNGDLYKNSCLGMSWEGL